MTKPGEPSVFQKTERNIALMADYDAGLTYAALARKYGIVLERARQLVRQRLRRRGLSWNAMDNEVKRRRAERRNEVSK